MMSSQFRKRRGLGRVRMHSLELFQLPERFFLGVLRHFCFEDLVAILLDLFVKLVALAKLALDRLQLLAQKILALRTVDVGACLRVDLLLDGQNIDLFAQQIVDAAQPRDRVRDIENALRVLDLQFEI